MLNKQKNILPSLFSQAIAQYVSLRYPLSTNPCIRRNLFFLANDRVTPNDLKKKWNIFFCPERIQSSAGRKSRDTTF